jgi:hypothetical protein
VDDGFSIDKAFQMARRHVNDGEKRLARQEALVAKLEVGGITDVLLAARQSLVAMHVTLNLARRDLERLENKTEARSRAR